MGGVEKAGQGGENKQTYYVLQEGQNQAYGKFKDQNIPEDIIQTSDGTVWGIRYSDSDGNKSNYENVSIHTYKSVDGQLVSNNDYQTVERLSDLTKEYTVFGEQRSIVREEPYVITRREDGYNGDYPHKGLVDFLSKKLSDEANNTGVEPARTGFISGENNSHYLVPLGDGRMRRREKPAIFAPDAQDRNKIEPIPEDLSSRKPDHINFFEKKPE